MVLLFAGRRMWHQAPSRNTKEMQSDELFSTSVCAGLNCIALCLCYISVNIYLLCYHSTQLSPFDIMHVILWSVVLHHSLQDISSGYWVLVLHFSRKEAVRQIDELQHIATNLGRSKTSLKLNGTLACTEHWGVRLGWTFQNDLFSLCRPCMVIPCIEWELFGELSTPLPGEPSITAEVLFQVSHSEILMLMMRNLSNCSM